MFGIINPLSLKRAIGLLFVGLGAFYFFDGWKNVGFSLELIQYLILAIALIIGGNFLKK